MPSERRADARGATEVEHLIRVGWAGCAQALRLQSEYDAEVAQCDFGCHASKAGALISQERLRYRDARRKLKSVSAYTLSCAA
jgi:hypothetical protein